MSSLTGANGFNNLSSTIKQKSILENLEHLAGHTSLDLSYKRPSPIIETLTANVSQLNGKMADLTYLPTITRSRPDMNYDAGYDPTLTDAVKYKLVDVSGALIPNKELPSNTNVNKSQFPLKPFGIVG